jgi:hypothetical protein
MTFSPTNGGMEPTCPLLDPSSLALFLLRKDLSTSLEADMSMETL